MKQFTLVCAALLMTQALSAQRLSKEIPENSVIYALPQTVVEISVEIKKDLYIPGPYVRYAETMLSIENVPVKSETSYSIGSVTVSPIIEADYNYMYALPINKKENIEATFLSLSSEGLIYAPDAPKTVKADFVPSTKNYLLYSDQIPSYPISIQKENVIDRVKTDTGFVNVPYQESIISEKDPQSKAEEAAKFIFSLRKRRFELVTGDVEHAFGGSSIKDALNEINRLEHEYMSLFTGKHLVESRTHKFYVVPEKAFDIKIYTVFHFSERDGALHDANRSSIPFVLHVTPNGKISELEKMQSKIGIDNVFYRVPETATVQLFQGSKEICSARMQIYQLGKELAVPFDAKLK
jgi:hypothetical protein